MRNARIPSRPASALIVFSVVLAGAIVPVSSENIDPADDGSQYAWAENVGWFDAEPSGAGGPGIQVGDSELSGWMWGENVGWVSLSCKNTLTCATVDYGVANDGNGALSGYAWAENVGWIDFAPSTSGVVIDPATGDFSGFAWAENVGWISFNCADTASCTAADYKISTGWICLPPPPAPAGIPELTAETSGAATLLSWNRVPDATGSDIVYGGLKCLRNSGGDFTSCTAGCQDDNRTTTTALFDLTPAPGDGFWFLVRGQNCGGNGTYDSGGAAQAGARDAEIAASGHDCT